MTASTLTTPLPLRTAANRFGPFEFLRRLFRTTQAQIGGAIVLLLLLTAMFAPLVAPYDPYELRVGSAKGSALARVSLWH